MLFKHIERELMEGEPWAAHPIERIEYDYQMRDFWEVESKQKHTFRKRLLMINPRHWRAWLSWKSLF